jgi:DNA-binding winged helix-turn-helix (wHTH) protein
MSGEATVQTRLDFRILGELEVRVDGGSAEALTDGQRALLTTLLLHANECVPRDELARRLWPNDATGTALRRLGTQVSGVRRKLVGPGNRPLIESSPAGYVLSVDPDELDALRFRLLSQEGREALAAGDARTAAELLGEALDLWRGPVLGGDLEGPGAQEARRLEGLRATAAAALVEARRTLIDEPAPEVESQIAMVDRQASSASPASPGHETTPDEAPETGVEQIGVLSEEGAEPFSEPSEYETSGPLLGRPRTAEIAVVLLIAVAVFAIAAALLLLRG